jgi:hypothetical protein
MTMTWNRLTLPLAMALLPACTPTPDEVPPVISESESGASSSSGPGPTTMPPTTQTGEETVGTQSGTDTTMGVVDDTGTTADETTMGMEPTTSDGTSSDGGESSSTTGPLVCETPCGSNQECVDGVCVEACGGNWGAGNYGYCLDGFGGFDTTASCGPNSSCLYWIDAATSDISEVACSSQGCTTACDCPEPPMSGNAVVACGQITDPPEMNDCYLSCANGETCPNDMTCNSGGVCVGVVPEVAVHGACGYLAPDCAGNGFCSGVGSGEAICMLPCGDVGDCPAGPPTGTAVVACGDASNSAGLECYLDCESGTCPTGMSCFFDSICLWDNL